MANISISESIKIWDRVLETLKERLDRNIFEQFFADSYIYTIQGDTLIIVVNGKLAVTLIEKQHQELLNEAILEVTQTVFKTKLITEEEKIKNAPKEPVKTEEVVFKNSRLNFNLTFDNYIVGSCNRTAAQAALMIAATPGKMFNPLFIYSESGLGKTHLLHAVGNKIKFANPNAKVVCITADDFFNEYVSFLTTNKDTGVLRDYCRNIDAFLIDDIQFLKDKTRTQELFYFIFNDLISLGKQIVITSDRMPKDLQDIEDRLITRFSSGLTVNIEEPDHETCVSILKLKIQNNNISELEFDDSALELLASKFSRNIRELEGALNKLVYFAIMKPTSRVDVALTCEAISSLTGSKFIQDEINEQSIISLVADYYNLTPSVLTGNSHTSQIVLARHVAMYLMRVTLTDISLKKIGAAFGGKDHSTVMSGISKVEKLLKTDASMQAAIKELKEMVKDK